MIHVLIAQDPTGSILYLECFPTHMSAFKKWREDRGQWKLKSADLRLYSVDD